jgi:hypothetical protein
MAGRKPAGVGIHSRADILARWEASGRKGGQEALARIEALEAKYGVKYNESLPAWAVTELAQPLPCCDKPCCGYVVR